MDNKELVARSNKSPSSFWHWVTTLAFWNSGRNWLRDLSPSPSGSENSEQKTILTLYGKYMAVCQNLVPLVNIKIAGKWMFIPLKMYL